MLVRRIVPAVNDRREITPLRCLRRPIPGFLALSCQIDPPVGVGRDIVPESVTSYSCIRTPTCTRVLSPDSKGGGPHERDAAEALERALEHLRRQKGVDSTLTLKELVEEYLAQYDAEPETIDKLCWLLAKALRAFGGRRLPELRSQEIAAWRMTISLRAVFDAARLAADCHRLQPRGSIKAPCSVVC